ncbi:MAG: hypothetical protein E7117_00850 [Bacteroidales bacterium]|nr:hypothetical protein [Bacteroidales bacterium]
MKIFRMSILFAMTVIAASCNLDDAQYVTIDELAVSEIAENVAVEGGSVTFRIYSNSDVTLAPRGGLQEWAQVSTMAFSGDSDVTVTFQPNEEGLRRGVVLDVVSSTGKTMEVVVKQDGKEPYLKCMTPFRSVSGKDNTEMEFSLETNVDHSLLNVAIAYLSGSDGWISVSKLEGGRLKASISANATDKVNKAKVTVSFTDGWNEYHSADFYVTQSDRNGNFGKPVSFADARSLASAAAITENYVIEGVVVSDSDSRNMGLNPALSAKIVDVTVSDRTAYIQSIDGKYGFRVIYDEVSDNLLKHGTSVTLSLQGTVLSMENDPERYTISSVSGENVMESSDGAEVVVKEKNITELVPEDIYTWVTLKDVELAVKEGSYTDIRENYALETSVNTACPNSSSARYFYMDNWATLLTDCTGNAIYAPINMLCEWRKPDAGAPRGKGCVSGIIVSEDIRRYGNVGQYQLRVVDETGFDFGEPSVWTVLAKWDGFGASSDNRYDKDLTASIPADDNAAVTLKCEKTTSGTFSDQHSYKSIAAVTNRTCGISDLYRALMIKSDMRGWYIFEGEEVVGYNGVRLDFSTVGISGSQMMLMFSFYSGQTLALATIRSYPSHWCVEYSIDGGREWNMAVSSATGEKYVHLHTLPYVETSLNGNLYQTCTSAGLGATTHAFCFPEEIFGKEDVRVRIRPYDTVISSLPVHYDGETETSHINPYIVYEDYVAFENIFLRYR